MKHLRACFCIVCIVGLLISPRAKAQDKEVRIGFVLPLSGDWAFLGAGVRDAARLAEQDLKGQSFAPRLFFEDNGGQLKESATSANRLISVEKVDAIISVFSGVALLISAIAEKAQVINFGLCSNTSVANGSFSFTNYITAREGAARFLEEMENRYPHGAKLGIFSMNEEGFNQIVEQVREQSVGRSVRVQFVESFQPDVRDFRTQIVRTFKKDPQILLLLGLSPGIEIFSKQLRDLHHELPLTSIEAFGLAEQKSAFNGAWYIDAAAPSQEFEAKFRAVYGRDLTAAAAHAYDTVQLLTQAFQLSSFSEEGKPPRRSVASLLRTKGKFQGVVGTLFVDEKGIVHSVPSVKVMKEGIGIVQR